MTRSNLLAALFVVSIAAGAPAQTISAAPQGDAATSAASMTEGEVRKVDKEAGKVTLRHGPIANLDMPGMTMVFKAADPKMLESLKEGDKVRFSADRINGAIAITRIEDLSQ
ncbi:copper-binding protein [Variovorax humicola]|uniref:Copper-binding protein n=1 Tax=Variovorax humicola TaxID=1769758 RepID=A0ABU8WAB3_9BURK